MREADGAPGERRPAEGGAEGPEDCGEMRWDEVHKVRESVRFEWTVVRLEQEALRRAGKLVSPELRAEWAPGLAWRLSLSALQQDLVCLRAELQGLPGPSGASYQLGLLKEQARGEQQQQPAQERRLDVVHDRHGRYSFSVVALGHLSRTCGWAERRPLRFFCEIGVRPCGPEGPRGGLAADLGRLLASGSLSDVRLVAGTRHFAAHRSILASRSPVFAAMFNPSYSTVESRDSLVRISDLPADALQHMLHFIYTGRLERPDSAASIELFKAADKYALDELKRLCEGPICAGLRVDNAIELLVAGHMHSAPGIKLAAQNFIRDNAAKVKHTHAYKSLPTHHLYLLLEIFF